MTVPVAASDSKGLNSPPRIKKPFYELRYGYLGADLPAVKLPPNQRQVRGVSLRRSARWVDYLPEFNQMEFDLPLIDRLGRYTGKALYSIACRPTDVVATVISTIFSRLKRYSCYHNSFRAFKLREKDIFRAAVLYALSKNSYYMDRILYFLRDLKERGRLIHPVTLHFLSKGNEDKRFVYGQACYQANWLIFRAAKPRDKLPFLNKYDSRSPTFRGKPRTLRRSQSRLAAAKFGYEMAVGSRIFRAKTPATSGS